MDIQTDISTDIQMDRHTDRYTNGHMDGHTDEHTDGHMDGHTDRHVHIRSPSGIRSLALKGFFLVSFSMGSRREISRVMWV